MTKRNRRITEIVIQIREFNGVDINLVIWKNRVETIQANPVW